MEPAMNAEQIVKFIRKATSEISVAIGGEPGTTRAQS